MCLLAVFGDGLWYCARDEGAQGQTKSAHKCQVVSFEGDVLLPPGPGTHTAGTHTGSRPAHPPSTTSAQGGAARAGSDPTWLHGRTVGTWSTLEKRRKKRRVGASALSPCLFLGARRRTHAVVFSRFTATQLELTHMRFAWLVVSAGRGAQGAGEREERTSEEFNPTFFLSRSQQKKRLGGAFFFSRLSCWPHARRHDVLDVRHPPRPQPRALTKQAFAPSPSADA